MGLFHKPEVIVVKESSDTKLVVRNGKFGKFIGCSNYPKCRYTKNID